MMKIFKIGVLAIASILFVIVLASYFIWLTYPSVKLNILIMDKTVRNLDYAQHRSFTWVLNNAKILMNDGSNYSVSEDYYGFQPLTPLSDKQYKIKRITLETIDSLANTYDATYFTDTYGVYFNEWFRGFRKGGENSVIEGGLNQSDYLFLKAMKDRKKLIIGEYNILWGATSDLNRYKTEELFGIQASGWSAKYYNTLDTMEDDELAEIAEKFQNESGNKWNYKGSGIVFIKQDKVVVLESDLHLNEDKPVIISADSICKAFEVPAQIAFHNWMEINWVPDSIETLAKFKLDLTDKGKETLNEFGLSGEFPAITTYQRNGQHLFYFSADFSNNKVITILSRMANSRKMVKRFTWDEQKSFFNEFYFPLMEHILLKYADEKNKK